MPTELTLYQIDAFTSETFKGNPAAVVPLQGWLPDALMQSIALENNLSETAFFSPTPDDPDHDFHLRWFTPALEVPLCGHATLATAAAIFDQMLWPKEEIRFNSLSGTLIVRRRDGMLELDFPVVPQTRAEPPAGFAETHGVSPVEYWTARKHMAVLESADQVLNFEPDMGYIGGLDGLGLIVTAPGAAQGCDCVSRFFAPRAGIPEDPVTGSAHCQIIPYWAGELGKTELHARQVSPRGGDLFCRLDGDRVRIAGKTALYMKGVIWV